MTGQFCDYKCPLRAFETMKSIPLLCSASNVLASCPDVSLSDVKNPTAPSWQRKVKYLLSLPICAQALKSRPLAPRENDHP